MYAEPPINNLLVLRSPDIGRAAEFYRQLGLLFTKHSHGSGPEHYSSNVCGFVFEIYPSRDENDVTYNTRIGFSVDSVDGCLELLEKLNVDVVSPAKDSEWGRRAVVRDLDGHTVELVTPPNRETTIQMQHAPEDAG